MCILFDFIPAAGFGEDAMLSASFGGGCSGQASLETLLGFFKIGVGCRGEGLPCEVEGRATSVASPAVNGAEPGLRVADTGGPRTLMPEELRVTASLPMWAGSLEGRLWQELLLSEDQGREGTGSLGVGGVDKLGKSKGDGRLLEGSSGGGVSAGDS